MKDEECSNESNDAQFEIFIHSIKIGNIEYAKSYFKEEFSKKIDKYGLQPIHWASLSCNVDLLKWMLENKCSIESSSRNGWRPIHFAAFAGDEEMVKCLIENYCKLDCQTDRGETISDIANGDCEHEFIDEILNETKLKFALSMGLKCDDDCNHKLCLKSVLRGKFYKDEIIGGGAFVKVYIYIQLYIDMYIYGVRDSPTDKIFAVRLINKKGYSIDEKSILSRFNQYPSKLNHENIIKYFEKIETPTHWKIFMECMYKGSIFDEIESTGFLPDDKITRYCKDILQAVAFLHRNKIIHRDIKPSKILIDKNERCKLSISSFSCFMSNDEMATTFCGTMKFMAPEIINNEPYNYPVDIWAVGATVIHMVTGHSPYHGLQPEAAVYKIGTTKKLEYTNRNISNQIKNFIDDMTKPEPNERSTADELLNYELIKNVSNDCEINKSNTEKSISDHSTINRQQCMNLIHNAINNHKIGLSMGLLQCKDQCEHEFCLSSVTATNFKKGKKIGKGAGGEVYKINFNSEMFWAMKIIENVDEENIKKEAKYFENDINRYREFIDHENIVKYFGAVRNFKKIFIFMEFIDGESLYQKIKKNQYKPLPLTTIKQYTKQILEGLKFLHDKHIIHRDIKSANILINKNNIVKIADFGVSRFLRTMSKHLKKSFCGTVNYMSPEVIKDIPYDCSADIWSLGATVFEMATGHPPYYDKYEATVIFKIGKYKTIEYPPNIPDDIKQFLDLMINTKPFNRWTADSLLSSEFFN